MSTRREILAAGATIAASLLAGCGERSSAPTGGSATIARDEVPVGGGVVLTEARLVVTQPEDGVFVAFSAVCTHQGCVVREVREEGIHCACHGSLFGSSDGAPLAGPATEPLLPARVTEEGDNLLVEA